MDMRAPLALLPLRLDGVAFEVGARRIIRGVSITLEAGPRTVILGPNGAGKSVLLRLCHGSAAADDRAHRLECGRSFPARRGARRWCSSGRSCCAARRSATSSTRLKLAGVSHRAAPSSARMEALRNVGLEGAFASHSARVLSGGEQQRLALARVWALHPEVLFLDEPTASLDPGATHEIETDHRRPARRRHQDRHGDAQPRAGASPGRRDPVPAPGPARGARAGRPFPRSSRPRPRPRNSWKENCHGDRAPLLHRRSCLAACPPSPRRRRTRFIVVASTTSTEQSGLFGYLLPMFEKQTGIQVRVVALGTGQALDLARRGDADVVFVHAKPAEEKFLAEGHGVKRYPVMYNDFVLIGPKSDPAKIAGGKDILDGAEEDRGGPGAVRLARRQERHAHGRAQAVEGGRHRHRQSQGAVVSRHRAGHGTGAQHRVVDERLHARRPRRPGSRSRTAAISRSWSKATSACSTSTA